MRRNASLFVAISLLSGFGSTAMSLVAGIWILDLTGSSSLAGLAGLCVYAPTLAAPWLGAIIDRLPRRPLVIGVDLLLSAVLLTLLTVHSRAGTWLIFAVMLGYGISYVLLDAGETALLPAALPADALGDVNGWRSSAQEGMKLLAPLAGAAVYSWHGGGSVAALSATMPLIVAGLYGLIRLNTPAHHAVAAPTPPPPAVTPSAPAGPAVGAAAAAEAPSAPVARSSPAPPAPMSAAFAPVGGGEAAEVLDRGVLAGLALLWRQPAIRVPVLVAGISIAMSGFTTPAIYAVVTQRLGLPSTFIGILGGAQGAGSIAGGLVVGRLITRAGSTVVAAVGAMLCTVGCLCRCLPWPAALVVAGLLTGVGLPWTLIAGVTAVQTHTPDALLGRVAATAGSAMFGPNALAIPLGAAAVHLGGTPPYLIAAAVCGTTSVLAFRHRRRESAAGIAAPRERRAPVAPRTGRATLWERRGPGASPAGITPRAGRAPSTAQSARVGRPRRASDRTR
jgi:MFS family permease